MRGKEEIQTEEKKVYHFKRCTGCGIKLHCDTYRCWKCGEKPTQGNFKSENPEDAKYCISLNNIEKCFQCYNVQNGLKVCEPIICFGTGKGRCDICKQEAGIRFECCQEYQKTEGVPSIEDIKKLISGNIFRKP